MLNMRIQVHVHIYVQAYSMTDVLYGNIKLPMHNIPVYVCTSILQLLQDIMLKK